VLSFEPAPADVGRGLVVEISPRDAFARDDVAFARVPEGERLPVVLATKGGAPSPWIERALVSDEGVALEKISAAELATARVERGALVVIDGACPADVPGGDLLVVNPPPGDCLGTAVGAPVDAPLLTSWDAADPRLRFLSLDGVSISRPSQLTAASPKSELVRGRNGPLVTDVSTPSRTGTLVGFDVGDSDWPLKASFVLFVRNVVEEARSHRSRGLVPNARTGEPLRVAVPDDVSSVEIAPPDGSQFSAIARDGLVVVPVVSRAGLYAVTFGGRSPGALILPVNLTSAAESDLSKSAELPASAGVTLHPAAEREPEHRELGYLFAALALGLLLFDVFWFTRGASRAPRALGPLAARGRGVR
jgi:hypothetical protein